MSHKHYCDVTGHEWQCIDSSCMCICDQPMDGGEHSECPVELRACPEHPQPPVSPSDELFSGAFGHLPSDAEKPHCECGCADAHPEDIVGFCVWCSHVYISYDAKTEAQHFLDLCPGAPQEIREAAHSKLARLD